MCSNKNNLLIELLNSNVLCMTYIYSVSQCYTCICVNMCTVMIWLRNVFMKERYWMKFSLPFCLVGMTMRHTFTGFKYSYIWIHLLYIYVHVCIWSDLFWDAIYTVEKFYSLHVCTKALRRRRLRSLLFWHYLYVHIYDNVIVSYSYTHSTACSLYLS